MEAYWAPIGEPNSVDKRELLFTSQSVAICKSACLETLIAHLKEVKKVAEGDSPKLVHTLNAIIAATKLRQLESIADVATGSFGRRGIPTALSRGGDDATPPLLNTADVPNELSTNGGRAGTGRFL